MLPPLTILNTFAYVCAIFTVDCFAYVRVFLLVGCLLIGYRLIIVDEMKNSISVVSFYAINKCCKT